MTLIVGIKCSDGVVIWADGAATLGNVLAEATVIQPVNKLQVIQSRMIMGVSGQVGLSQLYCDRVESLWKDNKLGRSVSLPDVQRLLYESIRQDAHLAIAGANACVPLMGPNAAVLALTHSLIAIPVGGLNGRPELIQCNHIGMAEAATDDLPYVAIGSGQGLADPFLAFLRRIFWPNNTTMKLSDGVFAIVWTLQHAISVTPGGVSEPIQIAVLERKGNELASRILSPEELQEHRQNVLEAERFLTSFRKTPHITNESPLPSPP